MATINNLKSSVIDQIAAGEVVERPAHALKELIENSLDAKATEIEIDLEKGGRSFRVKDNGTGISAKDLPLALARHATSKISEASDLWKLHTYGFRGEALAALGSVSDLELISRPEGQEQAGFIQSEFAKVKPVGFRPHPFGTELIVRDLFGNLPARQKFLKSDTAEISQMKTVIKAMALAHPEISFRVRHNGDLLYFWPKQEWKKRAEDVLDQKELKEVFKKVGNYSFRVFFTDPSQVQGQSRNIWIFVQGRWVQDRALTAAILEGYRHLLMKGEFPSAALFIDGPPAEIDVNVHPSKSQVRFRDASTMFRQVYHCIYDYWQATPYKPVLSAEAPVSTTESQTEASFAIEASGLQSTMPTLNQQSERSIETHETLHETLQVQEAFKQIEWQPAKETVQYQSKKMNFEQPLWPVKEAQAILQNFTPKNSWGSLQVLGQMNLTYILAQSEDRLVLIDQHAAHERVAFEKLMAAWKNGNQESQVYLMPLEIELTSEAVEALSGFQKELMQIGLELEAMDTTHVAVKSHPIWLKESGLSEGLKDLADEILNQGHGFVFENKMGDFFASMACHSVIRAGQALSYEEMKSLLQQMDEFPQSSFCPHGRPVSVTWTFNEIEKEFGRIV